MNKAAARGAVDSVFATIGEALANGDEMRDRGIRDVRCQDPAYPHRAQPPDRRGNFDIGVEVSLVQGGEGAQGCSERRRDAVTAG